MESGLLGFPLVRAAVRFALIGLVLALGACATERAGDPAVVGASVAELARAIEDYRLGPGDKVLLQVFGQEDLSGEFEISAIGDIAVPLVGQIEAANLTLAELTAKVTEILNREFVVDPQVSIQITNYRPFFILGQVKKPGSYPYQAGLTVRMAVAVAEGYTRRAREQPVVIIRLDAAGKRVKFKALQDDPVLPGDTIEIARRLF